MNAQARSTPMDVVAIVQLSQYSLNPETDMTMNETTSVIKDPVCGMTVDEATAIHAERDGKKYYFCSDVCRQKFVAAQMAGQ